VLAVTGRGVDSRLLLDEVWMITSRPLHQLVRATEVGRSSSYERFFWPWAYSTLPLTRSHLCRWGLQGFTCADIGCNATGGITNYTSVSVFPSPRR